MYKSFTFVFPTIKKIQMLNFKTYIQLCTKITIVNLQIQTYLKIIINCEKYIL